MSDFRDLSCAEMDFQKWDKSCAEHGTLPYNFAFFLNAVVPNAWRGFVFGDYERVFSYYAKKKYGVSYVCMPPFTQQFSNAHLSENEWNTIVHFLKQKYKRVDLRFSFAHEKTFLPKTNMVLYKKNRTFSEIKSHYSKLLTRNLKKYEAVEIIESEWNSEILNLYMSSPFYEKAVRDWEGFSNGIESLKEHTTIYLATFCGEICAAMILLKHRNRAIFWLPVSNELGRTVQAMAHLMNHIIENTDAEIVDFEGSSVENIALFYRQFSPETEVYYAMNWKKWF